MTLGRLRCLWGRRLFVGIVILLLGVVDVGCGKKSAPRPPEATAPRGITNIETAPESDGVRFNWAAPTEDASGNRLSNLESITVKRGVFRNGVRLDPETLVELEAYGKDGAPVSRFEYLDRGVKPGVTYDYLFYPENSDGTRGLIAQIVRVTFRGTSSNVESILVGAGNQPGE